MSSGKGITESLEVLVTEATGKIAYSLLPLIAGGEVFGAEHPIGLQLFDRQATESSLKGVVMELEDGAYPLLSSIEYANTLREAVQKSDVAIVVEETPEINRIDEKDNLFQNAGLSKYYFLVSLRENWAVAFRDLGEAINQYARRDIRIVVVGSHSNTNAAVLSYFAPKIDNKQITALSRMEQNRLSALASRLFKVPPHEVKNVFVWGGYGRKQYANILHGVTGESKFVKEDELVTPIKIVHLEALTEYLLNEPSFETQLIAACQNGCTRMSNVHHLPSPMSVAYAVGEHLKDWFLGTSDIVNMVVCSDGSYGIPKGIFFSFPCQCNGSKSYEIFPHFPCSSLDEIHIKRIVNELQEEKVSVIQ
eukprot:jgi/Galph1/3893/GphlegSOOS_G2527.1